VGDVKRGACRLCGRWVHVHIPQGRSDRSRSRGLSASRPPFGVAVLLLAGYPVTYHVVGPGPGMCVPKSTHVSLSPFLSVPVDVEKGLRRQEVGRRGGGHIHLEVEPGSRAR
jgi:hypothetical protein